MSDFTMRPLDLIIEPEAGNPLEVEGVLNPAAARGPDGELYLFPRLVGKGNYSRIGVARVNFDAAGEPCGLTRLGVALEPEAPYERRPDGGGGCEDPRVTFIEPLGHYSMSYTAYSPAGPRVAFAISHDLIHWERRGLATFEPFDGLEFEGVDNKDACLFPVAIPNPNEESEVAILHRPLFAGTSPEEMMGADAERTVDPMRESIWISYCSLYMEHDRPQHLGNFTSHHRLAAPEAPWESLKIGSGTPPVLTRHGWLFVYHGVSESETPSGEPHLTYRAGVMILSATHPQHVHYRSATPVLSPSASSAPRGVPADVVFPTGIDRRDDIGQPDRYDVYYGVNDFRIGVARLDLPATLPASDHAEPGAPP
ncbi:MAG: glycoside hydrolase family 130 protein [Acidimicrobiales bacterium]